MNRMQFTGTNIEELWEEFGATDIYGPTERNPDVLLVTTSQGEQKAHVGDWIVRDLTGGVVVFRDKGSKSLDGRNLCAHCGSRIARYGPHHQWKHSPDALNWDRPCVEGDDGHWAEPMV